MDKWDEAMECVPTDEEWQHLQHAPKDTRDLWDCMNESKSDVLLRFIKELRVMTMSEKIHMLEKCKIRLKVLDS